MKKLYLFFCLILTGFISQAQISNGTIVLGGSLGYSDQSYTTDIPGANPNSSNNIKTLGVGTSFGKAIKDNLVLGADISYDHSSSSYTPGTATTGNGFDAGVFLRKYKPLGAGFYLFGETKLGGSYMHNSAPVQPGSQLTRDVTDSYGFDLQFFPGLAYALSPKWQLEAELPSFLTIAYSHSMQTYTYTGQPDETFKDHSLSASLFTGSNILIVGVRYFIGN